jgi:hypothetical protein
MPVPDQPELLFLSSAAPPYFNAVFALDPTLTMTEVAAQRETIRQVKVGRHAAAEHPERSTGDCNLQKTSQAGSE